MNEYERRYQEAVDEATHAGLWRSSANPRTNQWLRKLGFKPRPPLYKPFWKSVLVNAIRFSLVLGIFMWLFQPDYRVLTFSSAILDSVQAGLIFGFLMAISEWWSRRRFKLSKWEEL